MSLLLLVLCEYVEVLELHALILGGDLLDVLLGLLVLAELTDEDLIVVLKLAYLLTVFCILLRCVMLLLEFVDSRVTLLQLLR